MSRVLKNSETVEEGDVWTSTGDLLPRSVIGWRVAAVRIDPYSCDETDTVTRPSAAPIERWSDDHAAYISSPVKVEEFLDAIEEVCRKFGYSISHEDGHGAFEIAPFDEYKLTWLRQASMNEGVE